MKKELSKYQPANEQVILKNQHTGRNTIVELWADPIGQYTVRSGANSDWSYTGLILNVANMDEMKVAIDSHYKAGKIFK